MLRVAVIGMGPIGTRHAKLYQEDDLTELVGVCDLREDRRAAAKRFRVSGFASAEKMLSELQPDFVSVATGGYEYGSDHFEPTMLALEVGCHVLCEKPIHNEISKAVEMVESAKRKNLCLGVNLNHRFTPATLLAKQWQEEDKIGHLLFINMSMWINNPTESSPWFHIKALHPHTVDVMRYFCGDIEAVQCFGMKAPGRSIWSTATFNMKFKNGTVGTLTGSYDIKRGHPMERCEVAGLNGRFVLEDMWRQVTLYPADSWEKTVYTNPLFGGMRDFEDTFRNRLHKFAQQLTEGAKPEEIDGSGADALAAQRVLQAAIESIQTGTVVQVS